MKKIALFILFVFLSTAMVQAAGNNYKDELKRIGYRYNIKAFIDAVMKSNDQAFRYFLHSTISVNEQNKRGVTPLIAAAITGNNYYAEELVNIAGADPNIKTDVGDAALNYAAYHGNFDLVHFLVSKGANVDTVNQKGDSPLIQAVFVNRYDIVMYLLFVGAEPNLRNLLGNTALHYASSFGNLETVKVLVANGADINSQNELQETPLFIASKNGRAKVVEYLLSTRKVDKKLTNFEGLYPLDIALKNHHEEIVNMLSK